MTAPIAMRDAVLRALLPYLSDARAGRAALRVCEAVAPYLAAQGMSAGTVKTPKAVEGEARQPGPEGMRP